eukprot:gene18341-35533_t
MLVLRSAVAVSARALCRSAAVSASTISERTVDVGGDGGGDGGGSSEKEMMVVGAACSDVFSGPRLAAILEDGLAYEQSVVETLKLQGDGAGSTTATTTTTTATTDAAAAATSTPFADVLTMHTSAGAPPAVDGFVDALAAHLPWAEAVEEDDWFVNMQLEGASAVAAATDLLIQMQHSGGRETLHMAERKKIAVGEYSYHGPGSTSVGSSAPFGYDDGVKRQQLSYPIPSQFARHPEESDDAFHSRLLDAFDGFLGQHAHEVAVMLVEPQWGSSLAALPWPPALLREYISRAKERGILVVADEIMCGLGRHGQGGSLFLSKAWNLDVDAVTFGKATGGGIYPLSGVIIRRGRGSFDVVKSAKTDSRKLIQMHTYASASQ